MQTKRVLVCSSHLPDYDRASGSLRIFHLVELLQEAGWAVSFLAHDATGGERYAKILQQRGVAVYAGPKSVMAGDEYLSDVTELIANGRFDLAILAFWYIAEQYLPLIRSLSPDTRVVVDSIDLHFLRQSRRTFQRSSRAQLPGVLRSEDGYDIIGELNAYAAADAVLTVSQKEADLLNDWLADPQMAQAVPDMEDLSLSKLPLVERKGISFIGNFRHPPNIEAVRYLCREILPLLDPAVLVQHPLYLVGNDPDGVLSEYARDLAGVQAVGWVPSVLPYLERARLSVVPLRYGAGTKRKLIQTLMLGTPCVSSSIGIEGLHLTAGEEVLVADDPTSFAQAITRLVKEPELWQKLAAQGHAQVVQTHSREAVRHRFLAVVEQLTCVPFPGE